MAHNAPENRPTWADRAELESMPSRKGYISEDAGSASSALELARYLMWLGEYVHDQQVTGEQLGDLAYGWITLGMWPGEVIVDLGLPEPPQYPEHSNDSIDDWRMP